jgi:uncharacterized protein YbjT (DUF2867 family)
MTILVTGGRGKVARAVAEGLLAAGLDVRVASREPAAAPAATGLAPVLLDFADPSSLSAALQDGPQVFLYANPLTAQAFVDAAEAAGVKQVVLMSSAAAQGDSASAEADPHGAAERIIAAGSFATTFLRPGAFMSNAHYWSYSIKATGQVRLPYLDAEEAPIHERDIADVAIQVLLDGPGSEHDGQGYELTGPESMTRRRQIELVGEITGIQVEPVDLTPEQGREELGRAIRSEAQLDSLLSYWASRVGIPHPVEPGVERITGHPGRPFTSWLQENLATFR